MRITIPQAAEILKTTKYATRQLVTEGLLKLDPKFPRSGLDYDQVRAFARSEEWKAWKTAPVTRKPNGTITQESAYHGSAFFQIRFEQLDDQLHGANEAIAQILLRLNAIESRLTDVLLAKDGDR